MADELDLRDECVGEHHASLVALEGDVDGDNEIGCQGVADGSVLDEGHEHLRYHDCFLTHDVELAAIDVDIAAGEVDVVAYIDVEVLKIFGFGGLVSRFLVVVYEDVVDAHLMDVRHGVLVESYNT